MNLVSNVFSISPMLNSFVSVQTISFFFRKLYIVSKKLEPGSSADRFLLPVEVLEKGGEGVSLSVRIEMSPHLTLEKSLMEPVNGITGNKILRRRTGYQ